MQFILLLKLFFSAMYDNSQLSFEKQNEVPPLICPFADRCSGGGVSPSHFEKFLNYRSAYTQNGGTFLAN